jgi:predicted RNase H-like nuclease (RuvC/YqgF family)
MATKAQLEQKLSDLQAVLTAVQDEREDYKQEALGLRGKVVALERKIEMLEDQVSDIIELEDSADELRDEVDKRDDEIEILKDTVYQLGLDRERLLSIAGMTEHDFDLSTGTINAYLGKK